MNLNLWECKKTGKCCSLFVRTGPQLTIQEAELIVKRMIKLGLPDEDIAYVRENNIIPLIGNKIPKKCAFLNEKLCLINDIKPKLCKEYPLEIIEKGNSVRIIVSYDCPRGEELERIIRESPPKWIQEIIKGRKVETELKSFFEENIRIYKG